MTQMLRLEIRNLAMSKIRPWVSRFSVTSCQVALHSIISSMSTSNKGRSAERMSYVQVTNSTARICFALKAKRLLLAVWFTMGFVPLVLQIRSFMKFALPHKVPENLLVPLNAQKQTLNLTELCPVQGHWLSGVWWNLENTHYYPGEYGQICHFVTPQYNLHGNYVIENTKVVSSTASLFGCGEDAYPYSSYFYHGSVGYYSYFEEESGIYCTKNHVAYTTGEHFGTFDINGARLAEYTGKGGYAWSLWYTGMGFVWIVYRLFVLHRGFVSCKCYGERCDQMGKSLQRRQAMVFVQESLRLSYHGAPNYQRGVLLFLLIEGIMTDLFLIVANKGMWTKIQYVSLGYNLSGLLLVLFEILENTNWLSEQRRLLVKRLLFCYESTLVGELVSAAALNHVLTSLNRSDLKRSKPTALAVSYYFWSLVCHGIIILVIAATIISVRLFLSMGFAWWKHRSLAIFTLPCSVDSAYGVRNRMVMLGGYQLDNGKLYYTTRALKAFGLLQQVEEDGSEFLVLHKLKSFKSAENLFVIGTISNDRVEICPERQAYGAISFFDRNLGGDHVQGRAFFGFRYNQVVASPDP